MNFEIDYLKIKTNYFVGSKCVVTTNSRKRFYARSFLEVHVFKYGGILHDVIV